VRPVFPRGAARRAGRLVLGVALLPAASLCWAQASGPLRLKAATEIASFRLTGIEGHALLRYTSDTSSSVAPASAAATRARQSNLSEEIYLMTHSYIYHPSLLMLDLGLGPVIDKSRYDNEGEAGGAGGSGRRQLLNLNARATILRDKPYTGALFFDRGSQTQSVGPAQQMATQNTSLGATFSLRRAVTPVPLQIDLIRSKNQGSGADQVLDDRVDQLRLKLDSALGKLGSTAFRLVHTRQESASGSAGLPIQPNSSGSDRANLDTQLRFGADKEYELSNAVSLNRSSYTMGEGSFANLKDFSFGLDLRAHHSEDLQSQLHYNLHANKQDDQSMLQNSVNAALNYSFNPDLSGNLAVRADSSRGSQFNSTAFGIDGSVQYRQTLPWGMATTSYNASYSKHAQQEAALQSRMLGEHVTLAGSGFVALGKPQIVASTVQVSNLTRTQTFVEGSDYLLSQIGLELRIQRLIGGSIVDSQEVLLDYDYASGGSYASSQFDNGLSLSWAYKSYLNLSLRYQTSSPRLDSGESTSPLNPAKSLFYGARSDFPLSLGEQQFQLSASVEREIRREAILPYKRSSVEFLAETDLPWVNAGSLRLGQRQLRVEYADELLHGVNLASLDLRLWARVAKGVGVSAEASRYRDAGTPELRQGSLASIKAQWRQRKLSWTFDLNHSYEVQGVAERTRTFAQMLLRRDY
jgi:hypothetical protein